MIKLNAKQLRDIHESEAEAHVKTVERKPLYFILENIYDTYNIGGIFRLADALSVSKIYICGETEIPPNHKIQKASVGTYKVVPWEYKKTAIEAIEELRNTVIASKAKQSHQHNEIATSPPAPRNDIKIFAIEQDKKSVPYNSVSYSLPIALLVGNETYGVLPETLEKVDKILEIPMWGINKSLNVIVSAAIVGYHAVVRYQSSEV